MNFGLGIVSIWKGRVDIGEISRERNRKSDDHITLSMLVLWINFV
jgi:hypothetical protein